MHFREAIQMDKAIKYVPKRINKDDIIEQYEKGLIDAEELCNKVKAI